MYKSTDMGKKMYCKMQDLKSGKLERFKIGIFKAEGEKSNTYFLQFDDAQIPLFEVKEAG
jgi:hypothetical protein